MEELKLFMLLVGCKPINRHTEQHDVLFSIGTSLKDTLPDILNFWKDGGKIHIDAWREVTEVNGFNIRVVPRGKIEIQMNIPRLFFLNLGGYKPGEFEEYHYKMLVIADKQSEAIRQAKQTVFYKHTGFEGAVSHIDDKYGVDVDDMYEVDEILPAHVKDKYVLEMKPAIDSAEDKWHLGYTPLSRLTD